MSRVYEALRQSELERGATAPLLDPDSFLCEAVPTQQPVALAEQSVTWDQIASIHPRMRKNSRVVSLSDNKNLNAEKFRLLRARLRHLREKQQLRHIMITNAVPNEGKT